MKKTILTIISLMVCFTTVAQLNVKANIHTNKSAIEQQYADNEYLQLNVYQDKS